LKGKISNVEQRSLRALRRVIHWSVIIGAVGARQIGAAEIGGTSFVKDELVPGDRGVTGSLDARSFSADVRHTRPKPWLSDEGRSADGLC
jgi:hypothetical protein